MIVSIPLDKAKFLAREINDTVHAGTSVATYLNDRIQATEFVNSITPGVDFVWDIYSGDAQVRLYELYNFFNDVGMLS